MQLVIIPQIQTQYHLSALKTIYTSEHNHVLSGYQNQKLIILKLSSDISALKTEEIALDAFCNFGAIKVLASQDGILLMERATPGITLKSYFPLQDMLAIEITCAVITRLHQAPIPNHPFLHIKDWLENLDQKWPIPDFYLSKAQELSKMLLKSLSKPVLLHGDLHHDNILKNGNNWVVIDPKGVIGETAYEVAAFIRNPIPELLLEEDPQRIIRDRIAHFAKILTVSEQRVKDWCFVQSVLSWTWALEDNYDSDYFKKITEVFYCFVSAS